MSMLPNTYLPQYITTPDGVARALGLQPSAIHCPGFLAAIPGPIDPTLPESALCEFDDWPHQLAVLDQGSWNACTYYASTQALQYGRYQSGQPYTSLNPLWPYLLATGGQNVGTNLIEASLRIEQYGIPPVQAQPRSQAEISSDAQRFRFELSEQLSTYEQILSEVARHRAVVCSVCVSNRWNQLDAEGVPGVTRGQGNHAIFLGGGLIKSKVHGWMPKTVGTWGTAWGQGGFGWYSREHFDATRYFEAFTEAAVIEDLADGDNPPPVLIA